MNEDILDRMFRDRKKDKDFNLIQNPRLCKDLVDMQNGHYHRNDHGEHDHTRVNMDRRNSHDNHSRHQDVHSHERYCF